MHTRESAFAYGQWKSTGWCCGYVCVHVLCIHLFPAFMLAFTQCFAAKHRPITYTSQWCS